MNGLGNRGNSLAEFAVTMAIMATLATTAAPAFSRISEGAKAKQTKANLEKITKASQMWYNQQVEVYGMGKFPSQAHRTSSIGDIEDFNTENIIFVGARLQNDELYNQAKEKMNNKNIFSTGDCVAPGMIQAAVLSGHTVARSIIEGDKDGFFLRDQIERFEFN